MNYSVQHHHSLYLMVSVSSVTVIHVHNKVAKEAILLTASFVKKLLNLSVWELRVGPGRFIC